ncbi:MAG: hypothetical protein GY927_23850 [bacterium]|nr:hypothetical protein [bacterium]
MGRFNLIISVLFSLGYYSQGSAIAIAQKADVQAAKGPALAASDKLNKLFSDLQHAPDEVQARLIEAKIWQHWTLSGASKIDSLMKQAKLLASRGHYEPSLGLLDRIIYEQPTYSEGWNRKATVLFFMRRNDESLKAIAKVLVLEPRHFGALAGKAMIKIRAQKWGEALDTLRSAVKIHPFLKERHFINILEKKLNIREL